MLMRTCPFTECTDAAPATAHAHHHLCCMRVWGAREVAHTPSLIFRPPHPLFLCCCTHLAVAVTVEPGPPAGRAGAAQPCYGCPAGLPVGCAADRPGVGSRADRLHTHRLWAPGPCCAGRISHGDVPGAHATLQVPVCWDGDTCLLLLPADDVGGCVVCAALTPR